MKGPQPASTQLPDGVELTLSELREMAGRQQQQIDDHQQQLVAKEQRLKYLKQQESRHQAMNSETERLRRLRERVEAQELKLRKLRALRGQSEQQRVNNNALSVDLENIRALFNEKEKELSLAVARVEEMTRQLEEVRRGRELRQGPQGDTHRELEKLRRELMYRNKLNEQQHSQLASQTETLGQRRDEMARIDKRIAELQQRLHRKRVHNQQLASQLHAASAAKRQVRQTTKPLPAPPHLRTKDDIGGEAADFGINKSDPKYQTLPYNTKFHVKEAGGPERPEEADQQVVTSAGVPSAIPRPAGPRAPPLGGALSQGGQLPQTILPQPYGQRAATQPSSRVSGLPRPVGVAAPASSASNTARVHGGAAPPLPNNLHADSAEVNSDRPLLPPKPASGALPAKPTSRVNGDTEPPAALTGDVTQVSVRGTQAKSNLQQYRYASRSQITSTYTNQHRPENGQQPPEPTSAFQQQLQQQQQQQQERLQQQQEQQQQQLQQQLQQHQQDEHQRLQQPQHPDHQPRKSTSDSSEDSPPVRVSINSRIAMPPAYMFPQLSPHEDTSRATDAADGATDRNDNPVDEVDRAPVADPRLRLGHEVTAAREKEGQKEQRLEDMELDGNLNPAENGLKDSSGDSSAADSPGSDGDGQPSVGPALRRRKASNLKTPGSTAKTHRVSFDPLALLLDASLEGELELVRKTAGEVRDPSASNDEGITALHNAICAGHFEIVKFLVEFGCDVNSQDSDGWTPLHCAASCNNLPMVRFLVEHGACIFATTLSDHETAAEKCEEDEEGYHGCSEYLYSIQEKLGILNSGRVYAVFDYAPQNADELPLTNGEPLSVLRKGDEVEREWWWTTGGEPPRDGYVPRNLLGLYPRVKPKSEREPAP